MRAGEILKQYRKIRGFTQVEVASIYGVSTSTYLSWEKSKTKVPFDDVIYLFEGVFKISQQKLFDEIIPQFEKLNG